MKYHDLIGKLMPLVVDYSNDPYIIHRNDGDWRLTWLNLDEKAAAEFYTNVKLRQDPYALMVKGDDFHRGNFPFVYDEVLKLRMREEYNSILPKFAKASKSAELHGLMDYLDENMGAISPAAAEHIAELEHPLSTMFSLVPIKLDGGELSDETANALIDAVEQITAFTEKVANSIKSQETPDGESNKGEKIMAERKILKTVAFQVDDPEFLEQYEARVKESGLSVKNYHIGLINADIAQNQTQKDSPIQDGGESAPQTEQTAAPQTVAQTVAVHKTPLYDVEIVKHSAPQPEEPAPEQGREAPAEDTKQVGAAETDTPEQEQADGADPKLEAPETSGPEEMMNLFVKITPDQKEALEAHKNETGETVGSVLNRLIHEFLDDYENGDLTDEFAETLKYYNDNAGECNTTASAKIPAKSNQELTDYLNQLGGTRNALMATLVHIDLHKQDMTQEQSISM